MGCGCKNKQNVSKTVTKKSAPANNVKPQKVGIRTIKREIR